MKHPNYSVIVAWSLGKEIQFKVDGNWIDFPITEETPYFDTEVEFRIKPVPKNLSAVTEFYSLERVES
jgi:hypothetical protein